MKIQSLNLASAVQQNGGSTRLPLNADWLGTFKLGQILPIYRRAVVPGDKLDVHFGCFSRFLPLVAPAYVDVTFRTLSVFVPYHQVFDGAESFFSNQKMYKGVSNDIPTFDLHHLALAFTKDSVLSSRVTSNGDFTYNGNSYKFTSRGNYAVKLLHSIGLRWPKQLDDTTKRRNLLPLLSLAHAYNCYMSYSPKQNTSALSNVLELVKRQGSAYSGGIGNLIYTIVTSILLTYEESFFTLAWQNPFYSQELTSQSQVPDFRQSAVNEGDDRFQNSIDVSYDGNLGAWMPDNTEPEINAATIRLLLRFEDYFRRSNYAGSKDIEQIYSRFGVKIDDYKTRYPYWLNESAQTVQVGDVTSTEASSGDLGAYAGKAIMSEDAGFKFESHDYGMVFTFAWFAPRPLYYKGIDKEFLRKEPFDFYTPEFDKGFPSDVSFEQVDSEIATQRLFGFVPLYSEYLYYPTTIIGDFERYAEFEAWHFGRTDLTSDDIAQSDKLIYYPQTGTPFERIFNVANSEYLDNDSIFTVVNIHDDEVRPMRNFTGKVDLGTGSVDVPRNGSQVN